jgi:hypothetical protein
MGETSRLAEFAAGLLRTLRETQWLAAVMALGGWLPGRTS